MKNKALMRKIITLSILHRYYLQHKAVSVGLYAGQPMVLEFLLQHGESAQKDIAAHAHVSAASVAVSLKRMEKNGLIAKTADAADLRRNKVQITEKGKEALAAFQAECNDLDDKMFHNLSDNERGQLDALLSRIIDNLLEGRGEAEIAKAFEMERANMTKTGKERK